jgi:hypothetical protein
MGSFDFPKIIAAAATSILGVLSLIVLAVCLLAYGFFKQSGDRVKLGVFALMLVAAVGFGVSVLQETPAPSTASAAPTPTTAPPATAANPASSSGATPASVDTGPAVATVSMTAAAAAPDISGTWRDEDGFTYLVKALGGQFSYEVLKDGTHAGSGQGAIVGRELRYAYVDDRNQDRGLCAAALSGDGRAIEGRCGDGRTEWAFRVER